jgi:exopolyphosphatase / guanosine-5'-triphosphate,3'-diphosphate pyrophosphatase
VSTAVRERIAAIDIGTNTVLLTVAELGKNRQILPTLELAQIARLGEGVDRARALGRAPMERTLNVLAEYARVCREHGVSRLLALGTSALRDAQGAGEFLTRAAALLGVGVEVASGRREAELTYRGAALAMGQEDGPAEPRERDVVKRLVFDVGGGSTEFILGSGDDVVLDALSLDIGSVRLFERHGMAHLGLPGELEPILAEVQLAVQCVPEPFFAEAKEIVGVAGTVASLYSMVHLGGAAEPNLAHGGRLTLREVNDAAERLTRLSLEERQRIPCLGKGRADVIAYGAVIVAEVLEARARITGEVDPSLLVSERGVRYGLLRELARAPE